MNKVELVPSWWDLAYLTYAPWDTGEPPDELVELESGTLKPCRILDIGCGTGTSVVYLASKGFKAVGIDISRVAIIRAKRKASKNKVKCEFHAIDFLNIEKLKMTLPEPFDATIDIGCLHSLSKVERNKYLESLKCVTRRGSTCLLWFFLPGDSRLQLYGPPGISESEVKRRFFKDFQIIERKKINSNHRAMMFYNMKRHQLKTKSANLWQGKNFRYLQRDYNNHQK